MARASASRCARWSRQRARAGAVLAQQAQMIARAEIGDAGRWRIVAAHTLVPDPRRGDDQPQKTGAPGPDAPIDLFAVDEKGGVEHADPLDDRHPQEDRAATDPVRLRQPGILAAVWLVLATVEGPPVRRDHAAGRLDHLGFAVVVDDRS